MSVRVLHLITGLGTGGAERMLVKLLKATDRARVEPVVVSLRDEGTQGAAIRELGVPLYVMGMRGLGGLGAGLRLHRSLRRLRPDLIHAWMYHGCLAAALTGGGVPMIWGIRQSLAGPQQDKRATQVVIRLLPRLARRARSITYNSFASARQHENLGYPAALTRVIPNGFDLDLFQARPGARLQARTALGLPEDAVVVGHLARLHPMKDHAGFLRAVGQVAKKHRELQVVMAGKDVDWRNRALVDGVREAGLLGRVLLLGERRDILLLLDAMDVFCSSSVGGEGFPNVIGEAMACEVPCVVTDVGDSAAIVGATGSVVSPSDPKALARAVGELLGMPQERRRELGRAARQRIEERYSLPVVVDQHQALYEDMASGGG